MSLKGVRRRTAPPSSEPTFANVKAPSGAVAQCGDKLFVFADLGDETCQGHGGVHIWVSRSASVDQARRTAPEATTAPSPAPSLAVAEPQQPSPLIGLKEEHIRQRFGAPSFSSNNVWQYDRDGGTLRVQFKDGVVVSATPADYDLSALTPHPVVSTSRPQAAAPTPPTGAVARCKDGLYVLVANGTKTCDGHGGVGEWLRKP
jgi:hypothetical protein